MSVGVQSGHAARLAPNSYIHLGTVVLRSKSRLSTMTVLRSALIFMLTAGLVGVVAVGCGSDSESTSADAVSIPADTAEIDTKADSVASRLVTAHGARALASARYLRFNFGLDTPDGSQVFGRHFWDRTSGQARVEWDQGPDSAYVAVIDVQGVEDESPEGRVFLNGTPLEGEKAEEARREAYGRFINDTYWLLVPVKVFDPGVHRAYLADSSTAEHDVIHLTFGDVGLTPGDEYWLYVSKETDRLDRWAFHLEGMDEEQPPQAFDWTNYVSLEAPSGTVELSTRKEAVGGKQALLTNALALPSSAPEDVFSNPNPMLAADEN